MFRKKEGGMRHELNEKGEEGRERKGMNLAKFDCLTRRKSMLTLQGSERRSD